MKNKAFTLIELLVVVGILAVIMSLLFPVFASYFQTARIQRAQGQLALLEAGIAQYHSRHGDYPPSAGDGENAGIESLVHHLLHSEGGPFVSPRQIRDWLGDTDGDGADEVLDPWGNPWIYFHHSSYAAEDVYYMIDGQRVNVEAGKSGGRSVNPTSYQIWSCGPNEVNQSGHDEDIGNLRR